MQQQHSLCCSWITAFTGFRDSGNTLGLMIHAITPGPYYCFPKLSIQSHYFLQKCRADYPSGQSRRAKDSLREGISRSNEAEVENCGTVVTLHLTKVKWPNIKTDRNQSFFSLHLSLLQSVLIDEASASKLKHVLLEASVVTGIPFIIMAIGIVFGIVFIVLVCRSRGVSEEVSSI